MRTQSIAVPLLLLACAGGGDTDAWVPALAAGPDNTDTGTGSFYDEPWTRPALTEAC